MQGKRRLHCLGALLAVLQLCVSHAAIAVAQTADGAARAKARSLGYAGAEAYAAGQYRDASAKLEESYQLLPVPSLGLWSAQTLAKLGRLVEAEERYRAVSGLTVSPSDPAAQTSAKAEAAREHSELLPKIPSLKIRIVGALADEVSVSVDDEERGSSELAVALLLNPGRHTPAGTRGSEHTNVILSLAEGAHEEVELRFNTPPLAEGSLSATVPPNGLSSVPDEQAARRRTLRTGAWVALGAGAAGLATGVAAYLMAQDQYDSFQRRDGCANGGCSRQEVDTYDTLRTLHLISLITGGALAAAGTTVLVVTWGDAAKQASTPGSIALRIGPGAAWALGAF